MIRLVFKNLWNRRAVNGWLTVELIIIAILAWIIIDPLVVSIYDRNSSPGYDIDRLVLLSVSATPKDSPRYNPAASDSVAVIDDYFRLLNMAAENPQIQSVTPIADGQALEGEGMMTQSLSTETDTVFPIKMFFVPGTGFFSTHGITASDPKTDIADLDSRSFSDNEIVITRELARRLFHDENAVGCVTVPYWGVETVVVGVIDDVRPKSPMNVTTMYFHPCRPISAGNFDGTKMPINDGFSIMLRLRQGVEPEKFVADNSEWANSLKAGNFYVSKMSSLLQNKRDIEESWGISNSERIGWTLAIFFLINLFLGVVGTFYLQTRRRSTEAGIMKAFGASPSHITATLILEGLILTAATWAVGCVVFMQYALKEGLAMSQANVPQLLNESWISHFWVHFMIISAIILILMSLAVVIGIYIPARKIAHTDIAYALKEE